MRNAAKLLGCSSSMEKEVTGSMAYLQGEGASVCGRRRRNPEGREGGTGPLLLVRCRAGAGGFSKRRHCHFRGLAGPPANAIHERAGAWRGTWAHQLMSNLRQWLSSLRGECECARGYEREACIDVHQVTAAYRCIAEEQSCCLSNGHAACCRPLCCLATQDN